MRVLSLNDGISCGMIALQRAKVDVERYVAYETDEDAIRVSKANFTSIEHKGSVIGADFSAYQGFDLLIARGIDGDRRKLFYEFIRAVQEVKPRFFMLERNASMPKKTRDNISRILKCEPVLIDSADFSAQQRKRLYWTNIPLLPYFVKHIVIGDILEEHAVREDVTEKIEKYVMSGSYRGQKIETLLRNSVRRPFQQARTIGAYAHDTGTNTFICIKVNGRFYKPTQLEFERLQALPDHYTSILPIKKAVSVISNAWTVDVVAYVFRGMTERW